MSCVPSTIPHLNHIFMFYDNNDDGDNHDGDIILFYGSQNNTLFTFVVVCVFLSTTHIQNPRREK